MRRRGEGSFYRERRKGRPDRFVVQWSLSNGKRVKRRYETEAEALAALKTTVPARIASTMSVGQYLDSWIATVRITLEPATWSTYEIAIRRWLKPNLGSTRLDRLSVAQVREYLHAVPLHPRTANHHRAILRKALNDAMADGLVDRNVAAMAKPPTVPQHERRWLDATELRALYDSTQDGSRHHALWVLAGTTGLRSAELLGLTWRDLDLDDRILRVRHTLHRVGGEWQLRAPKTKADRSVPLDDDTVRAMRAHRARQQEDALAGGHGAPRGLVFMSPTGLPIHRHDVPKWLRRDLAEAGLPEVTLHDLRHSPATAWVASGTDIVTVSRLLGHSTPAITMALYVHIGDDLKRDAVDRLSRRLEAG